MAEAELKQIKIRVSPAQHMLLTTASSMAGKTMSDFISDAAIDAARGLLGDPSKIKALLDATQSDSGSAKRSPKAKK